MRWLWFLVIFLGVIALAVFVYSWTLPSRPGPSVHEHQAHGPEESMRQATQAMEAKDYPKAIALLTRCLDAMPEDPLKGAVFATRARAKALSRQPEAAVADYTEAIRLCPNMPGFHRDRGEAYLALNDLAAAVADLTESIRLYPSDAESYALRAEAHRRSGKPADAFADERRAEQERVNSLKAGPGKQ